jgi:Zn-dependent protease
MLDPARVIDALFWFLAFLFSTTVHEAAHAFAALRGGDKTAYHGGQVSLSPVPHIRREPVGMVLVPLLTAFSNGWALGWASTPYDPIWAERYPRRAALMSLAGPAGNFLIAVLAFIGLRVGLSTGYFEFPGAALSLDQLVVHSEGTHNGVAAFLAKGLSVLLMLNVLLGTFNLLPLPPMDGASVVLGFLPPDLAEKWGAILRNGAFSLLGLLVAWLVFPKIAGPLYRLVLGALYPELL